MKIIATAATPEPAFIPVTVQITAETQEELNVLVALAQQPSSATSAMNEYAREFGGNKYLEVDYSVSYRVLGGLRTALRSVNRYKDVS